MPRTEAQDNMAQLFPDFEVNVADAVQPVAPIGFGESWAWDFDAKDFVSAYGRAEVAAPRLAWEQWVMNAVTTERGKFRAYPQSFGLDFDGIKELPSDERPNTIRAQIEQTVMSDPRSKSVSQFAFTDVGDSMDVSFLAESQLDTDPLLVNVEVPIG